MQFAICWVQWSSGSGAWYKSVKMAKSSDDIEADVLHWLRMVDLDALQGFCAELKVTIPVNKQGNKSLIIKLLLRYLHSEEVEDLEDNGHSIFFKLHSDLQELVDEKQGIVDKKLEQPANKEKLPGDTEVSGKNTLGVEAKSCAIQRFREFKISGSIGGLEQKDSLSYASLSFQMKQGKEAGYSHKEIQAAVIKAIRPGNNLRNYLESREKITELAFMQVLRSHFKEKDSTLVFHDLSNAVQLSSESELDFCLRVMSLRERVVTLSAEEGCLFDKSLLKKRFFHTLFTGLRHNNIRLELQNILKTGLISDEDLLQEISLSMSTELERTNKQKKVHVNEVSSGINQISNSQENSKNLLSKTEKKVKVNPLLSEINKLSAKVSELASVRDEIQDLKNQIQINYRQKPLNENLDSSVRRQSRRAWFRCRSCERTNNTFCNHCFSCGATDHRKNECPKHSKNL